MTSETSQPLGLGCNEGLERLVKERAAFEQWFSDFQNVAANFNWAAWKASASRADSLRNARDALKHAKTSMACTCTGFVMQYETGCQCNKGRAVRMANELLQAAVEAL